MSSNHNLIWAVDSFACGSISSSTLINLLKYVQFQREDDESGGVLLGYIDASTNGLLIENATFPGGGDISSRTSFFRSHRHQQDANKWISQSLEKKGTQLGLWHTHPEKTPLPSSVDLKDYNNVVRNSILNSGITYIIIGTETLGLWYGEEPQKLMFVGYYGVNDIITLEDSNE
jgi:integrative and conjugative element protein (TIGR02256 family)